MSRMLRTINQRQLAVGTVLEHDGSEWIDVFAHVGMDWVGVDMMEAGIDWSQAARLMQATHRCNMTPWIRLQAYPWGGSEPDTRLPADVLRALSIGAEAVCASVNSRRQVEAMLAPVDDWHSSFLKPRVGHSGSGAAAGADFSPIVFPLIESLEAVRNLDEILEIQSLRAISFGMGDLSRLMGHAGDYRSPAMRDFLRDAVGRAHRRDVMVFCNVPGSQNTDDPNEVSDAMRWLWDIGVQAIWMPALATIVERFYDRVLLSLAQALPEARPITSHGPHGGASARHA